jgi:hypothetical protein
MDDLTASQAADQAAAILQRLDADAKKAGDQAACPCLARPGSLSP